MSEEAFLRFQQERRPDKYLQLLSGSLEPVYVFAANNPPSFVDGFGLDVYKIQLPSETPFPVDHRQVVGDDGMGGSYVLEFYPKGGSGCGCSGATLVGPGELAYTHTKGKTAAEYISENGLRIVDRVDTSGTLVDLDLNGVARNYANGNAPTYILLFNDCGTIANSWLRNARERVKNYNPIPPGDIPEFP